LKSRFVVGAREDTNTTRRRETEKERSESGAVERGKAWGWRRDADPSARGDQMERSLVGSAVRDAAEG
jgi:hypothetical protein